LESFTASNPETTILLILAIFGLFHSGLAGLRPQGEVETTSIGEGDDWVDPLLIVSAEENDLNHERVPNHLSTPNAGEKMIGARAYRVIFALVSLPLAILAIVFFINHRYDGQWVNEECGPETLPTHV